MERLHNLGNIATPTLDQETIDKALKRLDERLFLDPEVDVSGSYLFWTVKYHLGDQPPALIYEWREQPQNGHIGQPRELSYAIVDEVQKREGGGEGLVARVIAKNAERMARIDAEKVDNLEEVLGDVGPRLASTRSAVLPRSQGLRRSRDRRRSRGEKL